MGRSRELRAPIVTYLLSRVALWFVIGSIRTVRPGQGFDRFAAGWDASWYRKVVLLGYPANVAPGTGNRAQSTLPFFPLYPRLSQWISQFGPFSLQRSMWLVNVALGAVAVVLWWRLVDRHFGPATANSVAALLCFFPSSYVFSVGYSEPLFICLVAACLLALEDRSWWLAGTWCALAGLTRPNAVTLILAVTWAAGIELRLILTGGSPRWSAVRGPLGALALAPAGMIGFFVFLWRRTGRAGVWFDVQHRGWGQQFDFGRHTLDVWWGLVHHPFLNVMDLINGVTAAFLVVGSVLLVRAVVPTTWKIYGLGLAVVALGSHTLSSTPRYALAATPILVAWVLPCSEVGRQRLVALCAVVLTLIAWLIGTTTLYVP